MKEVKEFKERVDELMECSEEDLSNCIARRNSKEKEKLFLKKILK